MQNVWMGPTRHSPSPSPVGALSVQVAGAGSLVSSRQSCGFVNSPGRAQIPLGHALLLVHGAFAEQLAGSAIVSGDPRQAVVRATLSAVNRRLESLLA